MSAVHISHLMMNDVIQHGDIVIDATAGNGHDTLFLSNCVGPNGIVIALDKQVEAINSTKRLLLQHDKLNVRYEVADHAIMASLFQQYMKKVSCITFNLGYLPGSGDRSIITHSESTIQALHASVQLLKDQGCISVIAYRGHDHGLDEASAVDEWMRTLSSGEWQVIHMVAINQSPNAPIVFFAQRKH